MKIAILNINYNKRGGSERRTYEIVKRFLNRDFEVHIFASNIEKLHSEEKIFYHKIPQIKIASFTKVLSYAYCVEKELKKYSFDIIHSQARTFRQDVVTVSGGCHKDYLNRIFKASNILYKFSKVLNPVNYSIFFIEKIQYRKENCKKIIANSNLSKNGILKYYSFPEKDISVIYNGVDIYEFNPTNTEKYRQKIREKFGIKDDDLLILFIGNGFKRKGLETLVRSIGILDEKVKKRVKLLIVGKGNPKHYLRLASSLKIRERIIFAGTQKETNKIYCAGDIFVLPTLFDPFSNVILEAMASGVPVITTSSNGASEVIESGREGFVIEREDISDLAEKIKILSDNNIRTDMGKKARLKAELFTWDKNVEETLRVYEEVLNSKR